MIYLVYSEDKEVLEKYVEKLIKKEKIEENSIIKYSLDNDNILDILEECNTTGLFSLKKLILLESTNTFSSKGKDIIELNEYLDNYNKDIVMIFTCISDKLDTRKKLYKKINSIGKIESLNKDNNYIVNLIKEKLEDYKISNYDIDYLIKKIGIILII